MQVRAREPGDSRGQLVPEDDPASPGTLAGSWFPRTTEIGWKMLKLMRHLKVGQNATTMKQLLQLQ